MFARLTICLIIGRNGAFLPGASTLSGLGIPGLPQDTQSALGRATNSNLSANSPESAQRLARPPSVCSSLQLQAPQPQYGTAGRRRYEKRGASVQRPDQPPSMQAPLAPVPGSEAGDSGSMMQENSMGDSTLEGRSPTPSLMVSGIIISPICATICTV